MKFDLLYKRTATGAVQTWTVEVEGDKYRAISGQLDGKKTAAKWTVAKAKNVGRSNETTAEEQAKLEAHAAHIKKIKDGYSLSMETMPERSATGKAFQCMLADNYNDKNSREKALKFMQMGKLLSQPKLDGIRCIITKDAMMSRKNRELVSAPHILESLRPFFEQCPDAILDGELFCDRRSVSFEDAISLAKKTKPTKEDLGESAKIVEYHIYDVAHLGNMNYTNRYEWLMENVRHHKGYTSKIRFVRCDVVNSEEDITRLLGEYTEEGFEGQILRLDGPYENKRSSYLQKHKDHEDLEFLILDIVEGEGNSSGQASEIVIKLPTEAPFKGGQCSVSVAGQVPYRTQLLRDKELYIGGQVTARFNELTAEGALRFGRALAGKVYPASTGRDM